MDYEYRNISKFKRDVYNACVKTHCGNRFLPNDQIERFSHELVIRSVIHEQGTGDAENLPHFISNDYCRIFLILILMGKFSWLQDLVNLGLKDQFLPLEFESGSDEIADAGIDEGSDRSTYGISASPLGLGKRFKFPDYFDCIDDVLSFEIRQKMLTAPVFGERTKFERIIQQSQLLPYLKDPSSDEKPAGEGYFSQVHKRLIHKAHLPGYLPNPGTNYVVVAIKDFKDPDGFSAKKDLINASTVKSQDYKSKHLVKAIAAYEIQDVGKYIMLPWADGGHLDKYWEGLPRGPLQRQDVMWILGEFVGLCSALELFHAQNFRHGDLKPENILWFKELNMPDNLKISDFGLATCHDIDKNTNVRANIHTLTPSGTNRYKPPEENDHRQPAARSRFYDIWSMGCTMTELMVWLIYGYDALREFQKWTTPYFWKEVPGSSGSKAKCHLDPRIGSYIETMIEHAQGCPAYTDITKLVWCRLLCVPYTAEYEYTTDLPDYRINAATLYKKIEEIYTRCGSDPSYLNFTSIARTTKPPKPAATAATVGGRLAVRGVSDKKPHLLPQGGSPNDEMIDDRVFVRRPTGELGSTTNTKIPNMSQMTAHDSQQSDALKEGWESVTNNELALKIINDLGWEKFAPRPPKTSSPHLCSSCQLRKTPRLFEDLTDLSEILPTRQKCDLCKMILDAVESAGYRPSGLMEFRQTETIIGIKNGPDLLSLYAAPSSSNLNGAQYGLPILPEVASKEEFTLLREWLKECDSHESCQRQISGNEEATIPTRLLEVGDPIHLVETASTGPLQYVALSHCWGPLKPEEKFCSTPENINLFRHSIPFDDLPKNFQDAVTVTRGIGIKYLWIDSLCIIQNDKKEWEIESAKMEDVFSGAYCTIAANSARSSLEGFLAPRIPRTCVVLPINNSERLHVCPSIDNFHRDVDQSPLNTRGWVLQERALSRRSIHYTANQVYWECGAGVQCETLARFQNSKAAFLGDVNFPNSALKYYRDGRQMLIQHLYEIYSQLLFSHPKDRPVAILGLQSRLSKAFRTRAMLGTFSKYFPRFLLWESAEPDQKGMQPIDFDSTGHKIPTWSWLSKQGAIRYMNLEFNKVTWATENFESPFSSHSDLGKGPFASSTMIEPTVFSGYAQNLNMTQEEVNDQIRFDSGAILPSNNLKCIVMGRDRISENSTTSKVYALIIRQDKHHLDEVAFERVGAASLYPYQVVAGGVWSLIH